MPLDAASFRVEAPDVARKSDQVLETPPGRTGAPLSYPSPKAPLSDANGDPGSPKHAHHPQKQFTLRSVLLGCLLGMLFAVIACKLNLTLAIIPSLQTASTILGFSFFQAYTALAHRLGFRNVAPFTAQENTILQTMISSIAGTVFSGGFGSYLTAMDEQTYKNLGNSKGNRPQDVVDPTYWRVFVYLMLISLLGTFILLPLRKTFILDYNLPYPSGTAAGIMLNSLHSLEGGVLARKQMRVLLNWGAVALFFSFFKWFYSANGANCSGFSSFPTLGLQAYTAGWYYDMSLTYIGVGMICPHAVNWSIMVGAIASWGIMWPLLGKMAGDWYPAGLTDKDFTGLFGYKVFLSIAVFLGDGAYMFGKMLVMSALHFHGHAWRLVKKCACRGCPCLPVTRTETEAAAAAPEEQPEPEVCISTLGDTMCLARTSIAPALRRRRPGSVGSTSEAAGLERRSVASLHDEVELIKQRRNHVFLNECFPIWWGFAGYGILAILAIFIVPVLYPPCHRLFVFVAFAVAPLFCCLNAYAAGLTDMDSSSLFGKLGIFLFAAWAGGNNGGVIAGLAVCGVLLSVTGAASGLMGDFRTGWVTETRPRAMFWSQVVGSALGCVIAPASFYLFYHTFPVGDPNSQYPAPYSTVYRAMAVLGTQGFSALPKHCLLMCMVAFVAAFVISAIRDWAPQRFKGYVPLPMAMALPFYIGAYVAVDMGLGSIVKGIWQLNSLQGQEAFGMVAASGLIAGEGVWAVPSALLAIFKINPPICMSFSAAS